MSLGVAQLRHLPILMLISFDGFRHDYLSPTLTPNLFDLSKQGTLGHMLSLYITKTFPNHFSMVTGLYEDEHEIINNKMYDPRLNTTFKPSVKAEEWWNPEGKTVPIWTANQIYGEKIGQRRYSASMMFPGSATSYQDTMPTHLKEYSKNANWTDNVETVISWLLHPDQPANLVTMYFDDPDTTAHLHGPWGQETLEAVRRVDSAAGYLVKRLREEGLADMTNIIFVSDHGMSEVKNLVYLSDLGVNTDNFDLYGNSPDWSVFVKPEKRHLKNKIFKELLNAQKKGHYRVYKRADIPPEYHYSKSLRIGDFFILADEKYDLYEDRPATTKNIPPVWGNHGWKPTNRDMRPLFLAYGPSFRKDYYYEKEFSNIDLFPLMVFLLDLPAATLPNNGSLARIVDVIDVGHFDSYNNSTGCKYSKEVDTVARRFIMIACASKFHLLLPNLCFHPSQTPPNSFSKTQLDLTPPPISTTDFITAATNLQLTLASGAQLSSQINNAFIMFLTIASLTIKLSGSKSMNLAYPVKI